MKNILFILFLFAGFIQAEEALPEWQKALRKLDSEEKLILECFFQMMLKESEGGFVLTGSKPVCMEGILVKSNVRCIGTEPHRRSVMMREGYRVWEKYFKHIPATNVVICCKDHPDRLYSDWVHLLWINTKRLMNVVQDNLVLFQYVLGPEVTAHAFLNFLTDSSQDVPNDYTLMGIILGFGTQNALYYRRYELIQKQICSKEYPPYIAKHKKMRIPNFGYLGFDKIEAFDIEPSFAYSTLQEEYHSLEKLGSSSRETMSTIPLFAIYKENSETRHLLTSYQRSQNEIDNILSAPNFLEQTLKHIFE